MAEKQPNRTEQDEASKRDRGLPGGGQGRIDEPGHTGVYPGSGPWPEGNAPIVQPGSFGQGERGPEGYEDSGDWSPEVFEKVKRDLEKREKEEKKP